MTMGWKWEILSYNLYFTYFLILHATYIILHAYLLGESSTIHFFFMLIMLQNATCKCTTKCLLSSSKHQKLNWLAYWSTRIVLGFDECANELKVQNMILSNSFHDKIVQIKNNNNNNNKF